VSVKEVEVDNLDELLASREMILRLIAGRKSMRAAARASNVLARKYRYQRTTDSRRYLVRGAQSASFGGIALAFLLGARWGGFRPRYRVPKTHQPSTRHPDNRHKSWREMFLVVAIRHGWVRILQRQQERTDRAHALHSASQALPELIELWSPEKTGAVAPTATSTQLTQ
jgi:hypothetical protein